MPNNNPFGKNQYGERDGSGDGRRDGSSDRDRSASPGKTTSSPPRTRGDERDPSWLNTAGDRKR